MARFSSRGMVLALALARVATLPASGPQAAVLALGVATALAGPSVHAGEPPGTEKYHGFDVALLAEALARHTTLRTQHGEKPGEAKLEEWLSSKGLSRAGYDKAYAAWWERFRADPSGQLEARFHRINAEWVQQLNYADAPDRRQEKRAGVTLEQYAKIVVALSRQPGGDVDKIAREHGFKDKAHFTKANQEWPKAMAEDKSTTLVQQYGALYQKYAGPQFQAELDARTANALAANRTATERPLSPKAPGIDEMVAELGSNVPKERWSAARLVGVQCDLWLGPAREDPKDPRARHCEPETLKKTLYPVMLDAVDHFDDGTVSNATAVLDLFGELGLKSPESKMAVQRALKRSEDRLATLEASFAPIKDKAVPERVFLRTKISDYTGAVRDFERALERW